MSDLRALIREILAEEVAVLGLGTGAGAARVERVRVATGAELTDFALALLRRAGEPDFAAALRDGRIRFEPEDAAPAPAPSPRPVRAATSAAARAEPVRIVATMPAPVPEIAGRLVTERDIAAIAAGETRLRIGKAARLTPLARDEARRRGIRIERTPA